MNIIYVDLCAAAIIFKTRHLHFSGEQNNDRPRRSYVIIACEQLRHVTDVELHLFNKFTRIIFFVLEFCSSLKMRRLIVINFPNMRLF